MGGQVKPVEVLIVDGTDDVFFSSRLRTGEWSTCSDSSNSADLGDEECEDALGNHQFELVAVVSLLLIDPNVQPGPASILV